MNKKLGPVSMMSSKGYTLERMNRHKLRYRSGGRSLTIEVEESASPLVSFARPVSEVIKGIFSALKARNDALLVYISMVQTWDAPNDADLIGEHELATIRDNIREGLEFLGVKCTFG